MADTPEPQDDQTLKSQIEDLWSELESLRLRARYLEDTLGRRL